MARSVNDAATSLTTVADDDQDGARGRTPAAPPRRVGPARVLYVASSLVVGLLGLLLVLAMHGYLPGLGQPALRTFLAVGDIQCLRRMGADALTGYCDSVGEPLGRPFLTGLPQLYTGWLLSYLPGVDAWRAHQMVNVLTDVAAFLGVAGLMRRWGAGLLLSAVAPTVYLSSTSLVSLNGFAFTFAGFLLLPLWLLLFLLMLDHAAAGRLWAALPIALVLPGFALFVDGYSFVATMVVTALLGLSWLLRRPARPRHMLVALVGWVSGVVLGYLVYTAYVPAGAATPTASIGAFRFFGLDVATLVLPQSNLWWAATLGLGFDLDGLWGDGSNIKGNYIGFVATALAVWFVARGVGSQSDATRAEVRAFAAAGVVALVLAIGPALKVYEMTVPIEGSDLPAELTTLPLPPLEWLYTNVPGFDSMRASYRSFTVTRLVVVVCSMLAVGALWRGGRRGLAVVLMVVAVGETLINVPRVIQGRDNSTAHVAPVRWEVVPDLQNVVEPGDRVLSLPASNDFLASILFSFSEATSYNVGTDKNYRVAREAWPASVERAAASFTADNREDAMCAALASGDVDVILLPRIGLYRNGLAWPPAEEETAVIDARIEAISLDERFDVDRSTWFAALRPAQSEAGAACLPGRDR